MRAALRWTLPIVLLACCIPATAGDGYSRYVNVRFKYVIAYPEKLLAGQGESDNGDGQRFVSRDGRAVLTVYGTHGDGATLRSMFNAACTEMTKVTYRACRASWYVVSGIRNGRIVYTRALKAAGVFKVFVMEYDAAQRAVYDPVVERVARSFASTQ